MQTRLWRQAEAERKITDWSETKNGGHVHRVLQNAQRNPRENAIKNRAPAMGQWVWPTADKKNEGSQRIVQWMIFEHLSFIHSYLYFLALNLPIRQYIHPNATFPL